jgi:hypothetical protein
MMKRFGAALVACLVPVAASADVWDVVEGPGGKIKGRWNVTVNGAALTGNATMGGADGRPLTFGLSGEQKDGGYMIHRINASDRKACTYIGRSQGGGVSGNVICNGVSAPWIATRVN